MVTIGADETDPALLGGKGAALSKLVSAAYPIPPTAVVTVAGYRAVAAHPTIRALVARVGSEDEPVAEDEVDAAFASVPIGDDLAAGIVEVARSIGGANGAIAVRSSATVEDLHGSSFAGQYRSLLNIDTGDDAAVLAAVRAVWASLWHPAPAAYRRAFAIDEDDVAMAVVLMAMVPATSAGVVFTADPGGSDGARVEAVEGLGEALVSGQTTPSAWVVPRPSGDEVPDLPPAPARALQLAMDIERHFDTPQDIEWAAVGDDVAIVQARPITVLDDQDGFDSPVDDHELTTAGIVEMVPGVLPALRWEINRLLLDEAFRSILDSLGLIRGTAAEERAFVRRVRGRAAIDFDQLREMASDLPGAVAELEQQYFGRADDVVDEALEPRPTGLLARLNGPIGRLTQDLRTLRTRRQVIEQAEILIRATAALGSRKPDLTTKDDAELLAYLRRLVDLAARGLAAELGVAAAGAAAYQRLQLQLSAHLGDEDGTAATQRVTAAGGLTVERHGHASAAIFAGPTWDDLGTVPVTPAGDPQHLEDERWPELRDRLRSLPGWTRRRVMTGGFVDVRLRLIHHLVVDVIEQLRRREAAKASFLELGGEVRRVMRELGARLVANGAIEHPDDVELLTSAEITVALGTRTGDAVAPVAPDAIRRRRNWLSRYEAEGALPIRFTGVPDREPEPLPDGDTLEGWAAGPGRRQGRARVVETATGRIERGEILVAETTDASWSPLFLRAGAVVVERGGPLSHAAILARELGLPAVLNVASASRVLDGRMVTVDGDRGKVVIEPDPEATPMASVPWPPARPIDDPLEGADIDRLQVFVPAIMSVGLLFSIATLVRDLFHWTGGRARERRTSIAAGMVVGVVLGEAEPDPDEIGILSRPTYLLTGMVLVAGAAYIAIGSTANFLRDGGYVHDIGWLLSISLGLAVLLGFLGGVSFAVFRSWPNPPAWTYGPLRNAPLSTTPTRRGQGPSWSLTASVLAAAVISGLLSLLVGSGRSVATDIDQPISDWLVDQLWLDRLDAIDPFGATIISVAFVVLIGLSGFRCRVMAAVYPIAFAVSWVGGTAVREIIERPRPTRFGDFESFPSGHLIQAVFIAGLVPLALNVLLADRRAATISRVVLGAGVIGTGLHRIHSRDHWALDVIAGITFGLVVVLAVHWAIEHRSWHRHCASCPWSSEPAPTPWRRGIVTLGRPTARRVGLIGAGLAIAAAAALAIGTTIIGLPTDPEGAGFGSAISTPFQLVLAASMAVAGALALRWRAAAAAIMALAATGLGLFASIEYRPLWAVALTSALLIPAVLTWLAWQPEETIGRIAVLAAVTTALLTTTALGSTEVYGHYFGPTHLDSGAEDLDSEAEWLWLGGVGTGTATVVAGGLDPGDDVTLRFWPASSEDERPTTAIGIDVVPGRADPDGVARFELDGLEPAASYAYRIDEDDDAPPDDDGSIPDPDATFTTFDDRPQDLVIVAGACARTGSNGAVFDAMVAERPDLYLALGDLHYGNLESTDPADHITLYGRSLSQDGQAALFSSVPTAYVWDDHDYGPNNADGSAPGREAVSEAYRRAVPHYGVDPDPAAPIAQVFTVGRVRFVLSDTRSHRSSASMLGQEQLAWLTDELVTSAADHAVVIWVNPTPWIGAAGASSDDWSGWADERRTIADALAGAEVDNLVMVSGDAHMVAIDDGTNSGYASDGWPGFPVLHAAALDRPGSVKGGPYSHGAVAGAGQYGRIEIDDDGGPTVTVRLSGHNWLDEELLDLEVTFEVEPRP